MKLELKSLSLATASQEKCDALIVLVSANEKLANSKLDAFIESAIAAQDLSAKSPNLLCYQHDATVARFLSVAFIERVSPSKLEAAVTASLTQLKSKALKRVVVVCNFTLAAEDMLPIARSLADANYVYTVTKPTAEKNHMESVCLAHNECTKALTPEFTKALAVIQGIEFTKNLANRPGNHCTPTLMAQFAKDMADKGDIDCTILDEKEVAKLGMGSFMSVAKGSAEPLKFIILKYIGASKNEAPVAIIGKGITFDSGGISLKPGERMDEMKFDMGGAASVLGTFKALSLIRPAINVVGLIPTCENMPGPTATKPGDVVTSMDGQTIEILNTDAEGRLILCDALTYAQQKIKPCLMIDIATLTGAIIMALGHLRSGLYSNNEALATDMLSSAQSTQDLCWRMPLDEFYADGLKSNFADIANIGDKFAGSTVAALFLQKFVKNDIPWAHLDIAGSAWNSAGKNKGATGRPVSLLVDFLCKKAELLSSANVKPIRAKKKQP